MIHLRSLSQKPFVKAQPDFPFNVPVMRALDELTFPTDITFLVGENGSGKSTLLEAIACAVGSITVGSESVNTDPSLKAVRQYAKHLQLVWSKRTRQGFFMRSEDFFGFAKKLAQSRAEMLAEMQEIDEEFKGRSDYAKGLAKGAFAKELHAMRQTYGDDLDANSHGESYFKLFQSRFIPGGLYLLDEPEAPLSPLRQLSLITLLNMMIQQDAQFIIATHSPILMAFPNATIYSFDEGQIQTVAYEDLEHVTITRSFLNDPAAYLKHLLEP